MPSPRKKINVLMYYAPQSRQPRLNMQQAPGFQILQTDDFSRVPLQLRQRSFDLLVLAAAKPDRTLMLLAQELSRRTSLGVLLLVPPAEYPGAFRQCTAHGVWTMTAPLEPGVLYQLLQNLLAQRRLLCSERRSNAAMHEELTDLKLIQRAKLLLMERLQMSESQAHRYLEKTAMDSSTPRREIAQNIIRTYDY